jgi:TRAP-type C4-dicarboxylate transport system permease small subunit
MTPEIVTKAFAAMPAAPDLSIGKPENVAITNIGTLIQGVLQGAIVISAILVFAYLIWGGIQWITSGGDKGKTQEARDRITAALVGLAVVASAWAIMLIISYFFGINILDGNITPPKAY